MKLLATIPFLATLVPAIASGEVIVSTDAYSWHGDTVTQGEFEAVAVSPECIRSTYHAQPRYYMGIKPEWTLRNDITPYPRLSTPNTMHTALYNMALDEMVNAVEPDTTLRTGAAWAGVWTRDVSYSIILSMAYMQPEASRISLMKKVDKAGRIIQDTGSGGAWPISTDRAIWAVAAYEIYKASGDRDWLEYIYPIIKRSLDDDLLTVHDSGTGLVKGETSFIDWRQQSHPQWMQCADIAGTLTLSTSAVHARALAVLSEIAARIGHKAESAHYRSKSETIAKAINEHLWLDDKGYYGMYLYGGDNLIMNPRVETLGESLAILWDIAPADRSRTITESNPTTPFGTAIFFPQIADMPPYHNNALWPWVASFWAMANAKAGNEHGVLEAIGSVVRPAALFCTNKENFVLDNGDIATQLNSSNMLWCLAGNIALTHKVLFGIDLTADGIAFHPFVPRALAASRRLDNFGYRDMTLDINISGYGDRIKSFKVNGKEQAPFIPADRKGKISVDIVMADSFEHDLKVNRQANAKAPLTPVAWIEGNTLMWNPVEYVHHYLVTRNGKEIAQLRSTTFDASIPGEYQVIAVAKDGTTSFASQPRSNRPTFKFEIPGESTSMKSPEILFKPSGNVNGYTGNGFVETDHQTGRLDIPVTVPESGEYVIRVRYANGNGPISTGNSAAVRTLWADGKRVSPIVMPHRGKRNWDDWGLSTPAKVYLDKGTHMVTLTLEPENENINLHTNHALIDALVVCRM